VNPPPEKIALDAVFFQYNRSGIARVWRSLLREWVRDGYADRIVVLDRHGTAPRIPGATYRTVPPHDYTRPNDDRAMLQRTCDEISAGLFVSSYYTIPIRTPSVFMAYDMIPEVLGWDVSANAMWREKHDAIRHASSFIAISRNTASDLCRFFPAIDPARVAVAHCGVDFTVPDAAAIDAFRAKHRIVRPYFLLVGSRASYKNAALFFRAFAALGDRRADYAIVCTGPWSTLEPEFAALAGAAQVHMIEVGDDDLQAAYGGAVALAYPSLYEGFGMPITEAMASGCPVITCPAGSIPEVAGDAALYVAPDDVDGMARALLQVQEPTMRAVLVAKGAQRAALFSWREMADEVKAALMRATQPRDTAGPAAGPAASAAAAAAASTPASASGLSRIIPGEIVGDEFYDALQRYARRPDLKTFLEIGSSSGAGSTRAFASALRERPDAADTRLFCMELSRERYAALRSAYADYPFVRVHNLSSVGLDEFPSEEEVAFFYRSTRTTLNTYPLPQVLSWLRQDIAYMRESGLTSNGIERIKLDHGIRHFDMVLIDGSEFTGEAELFHTIGARVIALDDVNSHKCFNVYRILANHVSYGLTVQNLQIRNGFAIFERRF
jgi:glycosyltransferase involved in cell wall biosynthesis